MNKEEFLKAMGGDSGHEMTIRPDITEYVHNHDAVRINAGEIAIGLSTDDEGEPEFHFILGPLSSYGYNPQQLRAVLASMTRCVEEAERGE